jgi:hypothetical protein
VTAGLHGRHRRFHGTAGPHTQGERVGIAVENRPLTGKNWLGQDKTGPTPPAGGKIATADAANDKGPSP